MKKIIINDKVVIRKEWFGAIIYNFENDEYIQINDDAFLIISLLKDGCSIDDLINKLQTEKLYINKDDLNNFINSLIYNKVISEHVKGVKGGIVYNLERLYKELKYLSSPATVTLYITDFCTKNCKHCISNSSPNLEIHSLETKQWKVIINKLKKIGVFSLVFTGGEPLARNDIFELLHYSDSLDFTISVLTDADFLNGSHINFFRNLKHLKDLQVSLDGGRQETHDFIRGNGSFNRAMKRLELLSEKNVDYTISVAVNKMNLDDIDEIVAISKRYNAKYLYLNPLAPYGRAKNEMIQYLLDEKELFTLSNKYIDIIKKGIDPGNQFWIDLARLNHVLEFNPLSGALDSLSLGIYNLCIDSHGRCFLDSKMKAEGIFYLGSVLNDDILKMWNSKSLINLRSLYNDNSYAYIDKNKVINL